MQRGDAGPSLLGQCCGDEGLPVPLQGRVARRRCPFPRVPSPQQDCAMPSLAAHPACTGHAGTSLTIDTAPRCWGTCWDGPQGQAAAEYSRAGRRGALSGAGLLPPEPMDTNTQALGREGKQRAGSCLPCSSQRALDLKRCQRGCEHHCQRGTGPPQRCKRTRDSVDCAQPPALQ